MNREGYWDYMGRRLREDRKLEGPRDDMWKREIAEMQKQVHGLQMRIVDLGDQVRHLNLKVKLLRRDSKQTEMVF
jgi:hypothetical protein